MNLQEVKQFLEENKDNEEVKTYLNSFKVEATLEVFKEKFNSDKDFKAFLDSEKDKHSSKSLETWKSNNLSKLIDEEVKKRFPEQDPKDAELAKLKAEMEQMKQDTLRKELTNKALKVATDKKLPLKLVDYFIGNDEESTTKNLEALEAVFNEKLETMVQDRIKDNSYVPPTSGGGETKGTYDTLLKNADNMTAEQVAEMFSKM